jgi:hypothetical protein
VDNKAVVSRELAKAFIFLGTDSHLPLPPKLREFYLDTAHRYQKAFSG